MSITLNAAEILPARQSVGVIPLDFLVTAFVAAGGMALSAASLALGGYDWVGAAQHFGLF